VALTTIIVSKEPAASGQAYQPLLLAQLQFPDGSIFYASTHNLNSAEGGNSYGGNDYLARIDSQDIAAIQARSEQGIDRISDATLHFFNADNFVYDGWETPPGKGFKGALLKLALVYMDVDPATGLYTFSTDAPAPVKFSGICDAPVCENGMLTVRATTSHSLGRVVFPNVPCQQRCVDPFPGTAAQRFSGASDLASWFYACGYCPDQAATDPVTGLSATRGNTTTPNLPDPTGPPGTLLTDSAGNYLSCNYTKPDCIARGMWDKDSANRITRRFTAIQWAPGSTENFSRKYGGDTVPVFSRRNDSIYGRNYPYVSGQQWVHSPLVVNVLGDANSTRMEVVIDCGDIGDFKSIAQVVVNGVIVPRLGDSFTGTGPFGTITRNPATDLFRWTLIATGSRTGAFTGDLPWKGQGDPYGSLAMIEIVVYAELAAGNSTPDVRVLLTGHKIKTPNTANPADQPSWPYVQTTLPPWLLLDLLIEGNYVYSEIDLQSFIDAANFCGLSFGGNNVAYVALDGSTRHHNRFIAEVALEDKKTGQEVIQALLRSFNAQLVPNSDTGLLSLFIRRTLADQQPNPIAGSNYNTAVKSIHVDGSAGSGFVAYLIDESVIQQDGNGNLKMRGPYSNATAQSPNRLTWPFQDADNAYADDSISVVDPADVARAGGFAAGGQQIPQQLPVIAISSFDQGIRIANVNLAETLRFNENRDSRGTRRWDIEATSRLEHLKAGQIILFQYQQINGAGSPPGLRPLTLLESPAGTQIPGILARVESIKPTTNYERVTVTIAMHEDYVYTDAYGQHAAPPFSDPGQLLNRPPYPWDPYGEQPATSILHDLTEWGFQLGQSYDVAADGSAMACLNVGGCAPVNVFGAVQPPLFQGVQASQSPAGGTIRGGQTLYAAISVQDANGKWSPLSKPCHTDMGAVAGVTNTFTTPTIFWQGAPAAWVIFSGISDQHWTAQKAVGQASIIGTGTPGTITLDTLGIQTFGAPDPLADSLVFQTKLIVHGGDWGDAVTTVAANTLSFLASAATVNQFVGQAISLYANPQGSTGPVPIADFFVTANTATDFTVTPDPVAAGIVAGMVFVMRSKYSATVDVLTNPNFINSYAPGGLSPSPGTPLAPDEVGNFARILMGTGVGQPPRQIIANTATTLTVDPPWEIAPAADSIIIIEEAAWHPSQPAKQSTSQINPAPTQVASVSILNYLKESVLIEALVEDAQGRPSLERFSPLREIYVWGGAGTGFGGGGYQLEVLV
jgi:hypothetical protein